MPANPIPTSLRLHTTQLLRHFSPQLPLLPYPTHTSRLCHLRPTTSPFPTRLHTLPSSRARPTPTSLQSQPTSAHLPPPSSLLWLEPPHTHAVLLSQPRHQDAQQAPSASNPSSIFDFFDKAFPAPRKSYVFSHAATGFSKVGGKKLVSPKISPEEDSKYCSMQVGEDSYFMRYDALGVADGVGGWSGTPGANPALYSRKMMHYAFMELERYDNIEDERFYEYSDVNPVEILEASYEQCQIDAMREGIVGSTTVCLAILRDDELRIANLGDCGLTIIRRNHFAFRTEEQQHSFNFPYQLGTGQFDRPSDAQQFRVRVQRGDIVVIGSDGVFDNLFDEDILEEVTRHVASRTAPPGAGRRSNLRIEPQVIADALANRAKSVSEDSRNANSPFQSRAVQEGLYYQGGKRDDISVLVAVINDSEDTPDRRMS
ncbi:hypothetical protein BC938DRAFT_481062 [Jimgerdemannia flammicorona]|uniref:Protein phosphatase n=1 Tax=Jimgerdemannia flammicorona TaxID=994334 RepID=A0A433QGY2_9FUNG|nr:hypothetical protein BC938DRAFT_481062 [Jimgerdemannia flammicorona]